MDENSKNLYVITSTFLDKREIMKDVKTEVVKTVVRPTILYGSETWTLCDKNISRINAMDMV